MNITASMVKELREISGAGMLDCKNALIETKGDKEKALDYLREKGIAKSTKRDSKIAAEGLTNVLYNEKKALILELNCETDFVSKNSDFSGMVNELSESILNSEVKILEEALNSKINSITVSEYIAEKIAKIGEKLELRRISVFEKETNEMFSKYIHMGGKISVLIKGTGSDEEILKSVAMHYAAMNPKYVSKSDVGEEELAKEKEILSKQMLEEGKPQEIVEKIVEGKISKFYQENCLLEQSFIKDDSLSVGKYLEMNDSTLLDIIRYEVGEGIEKPEEDFKKEVLDQIK